MSSRKTKKLLRELSLLQYLLTILICFPWLQFFYWRLEELPSNSFIIVYQLIKSLIYQFLPATATTLKSIESRKESVSERASPNKAILAFPVNKLIGQLMSHLEAINAGAVYM